MKFSLIIILFLSCTFSLEAADSIRMQSRNGRRVIVHQVGPKETLYSIARRYKTTIESIATWNKVMDNRISIGQFLEIPISDDGPEVLIHTVERGETLYRIATKYEVDVEDIKEWNQLKSNYLFVGQKLMIGGIKQEEPVESEEEKTVAMVDEYFVQTGESLNSIARKFKLEVDSIKNWNGLITDHLAIGQKLIFPVELIEDTLLAVQKLYVNTTYGSKKRYEENGDLPKILEEGIARKIEDILETSKYLALHRTLPIGTLMEVKNLMNNQKIYVRVVGKLPETGLNKNVMVRLSPVSFERLGIIDDKALVEISYYNPGD